MFSLGIGAEKNHLCLKNAYVSEIVQYKRTT